MSGTSIAYVLACFTTAAAGLYILSRAARLLGPARAVWRQRTESVGDLPAQGPAETRGRVTLDAGGEAALGPTGVASAVVRVQIVATRQQGKSTVTVGELLSVLPASNVLVKDGGGACELDLQHLALDGEHFVWAGTAPQFESFFPGWASQLNYNQASRVVVREERVALGSLVLVNGLVTGGAMVAAKDYRSTAQRPRLGGTPEQPLVLTHRSEGSFLLRSLAPLLAAALAGVLLLLQALALAVYRLALVYGL